MNNDIVFCSVADEFWVVKGVQGPQKARRLTREPVFADTERGRRAARYNAMVQARSAKQTPDKIIL